MAVTTKDIAKVCGVSRGTVDRALNNRAGISPKTKEKILKVAKDLGYRPDLLARSLVKGKTKTLGVIVFDLRNTFFAQLVDAMEIKARELGYFVYLTLTNKDKGMEKECIKRLLAQRVDGLIICPVNQGKCHEEYLKDLEIPLITVGNRLSSNFPYIGINDKKAMKDAVKLIIGKGYQEIIYLSPPLSYKEEMNIYAQQQRFIGFKEGLTESSEDIRSSIITEDDFKGIIGGIDFKQDLKQAILCSSDIFALEVLEELKEKNIRVPEDVGLMGFDNIGVLKYVEPVLTTISYPIKLIGKKAIEKIIKNIERDDMKNDIILEHEIITGDSL